MEKRIYVAEEGGATEGKPTVITEVETQQRKEKSTLDEINEKLDALLVASGISLGE